nr:oligoendopeptidase F [Conchiformibius kuhniae]
MITLDLPLNVERAVITQAQQAGMSLEHYLLQHISTLVQPPSVAQFVQGKRLESFGNDPVVRAESPAR